MSKFSALFGYTKIQKKFSPKIYPEPFVTFPHTDPLRPQESPHLITTRTMERCLSLPEFSTNILHISFSLYLTRVLHVPHDPSFLI